MGRVYRRVLYPSEIGNISRLLPTMKPKDRGMESLM